MPFLSASEYVRSYHNMPVFAVGPRGEKFIETVQITRYQVSSGGELSHLVRCLIKLLGRKSPPNLTTTTEAFTFPPSDVIGIPEPFYWQSLRRAYGFKGSPGEIKDAIRLAVRCGRVGLGKDVLGQPAAAPTMAQYAHKFFGLDCNGLVGNYFNLSPAVYIGSWATISAAGEKQVHDKLAASKSHYWNGWAKAEELTLDWIPLEPRKSAAEAKENDVLIDVQDGTKFAHIAVVQDVAVLDDKTVRWRVVEWGSGTSLDSVNPVNEVLHYYKDSHIKEITTHELKQGPKKNLGVGHTSMGGRRFRYLFAGPKTPWEPAQYGRCGMESI